MLDCIYLLKYEEELSIIFFIVETVEEVYIIKKYSNWKITRSISLVSSFKGLKVSKY